MSKNTLVKTYKNIMKNLKVFKFKIRVSQIPQFDLNNYFFG